MQSHIRIWIGALLVLMNTAAVSAQDSCEGVGAAAPGIRGVEEDYSRVARLLTSSPGTPSLRRPSRGMCNAGLWAHATRDTAGKRAALQLAPVTLDGIFNSAYPRGYGSGQLWPGRGLSLHVQAGIAIRVGAFSLAAVPGIAHMRNRNFVRPETSFADRSSDAYPWYRNIDWPLRHGPEPYWTVGPGQSYARVDFPWLAFGVSTENLWWGPAMRNSIILGNNAPGFPHAFLGSGEGWSTPIGALQVELIWGRLTESDHFDQDNANDQRLFTGVNLVYEPRGIGGLSLGAARTFQLPFGPGDARLRDFVPFLESPLKRDLSTPDNPRGSTTSDQIAGLFARYAPPRSGFETYVEWVRNDHSADMQDFWAEPDHSQAYTFGFQLVTPRLDRWYRVRGEVTSLSTYRPMVRGIPGWYTHSEATQGHTHRGQLLGASVGPGSVSYFVGADVFTRRGRHGVLLEHVKYDENTYFRHVRPVSHAPDTEWSLGTEHYVSLGAVDLLVGLTASSRRNRHYSSCNHVNPELCASASGRELNWHIPVGVMWRP